MVIDKLSERLMESALAMFRPQLETISQVRADELMMIRSKVHTNPDEVEAWFDKEIARLGSLSVSDILHNVKNLQS